MKTSRTRAARTIGLTLLAAGACLSLPIVIGAALEEPIPGPMPALPHPAPSVLRSSPDGDAAGGTTTRLHDAEPHRRSALPSAAEDAEAVPQPPPQSAARRLLDRLEQLAATLDAKDPLLFATGERLGALLREDPAELPIVLAALEGDELHPGAARAALLGLAQSHLARASVFLVDQLFEPTTSDARRVDTVRALAQVSSGEALRRALVSSDGLDEASRRTLLRVLALDGAADPTGDELSAQLLALEPRLAQAGMGDLWLEAMGKSADPSAAQHLEVYLGASEPGLRAAAVDALAACAGERATPALAGLLEHEGDHRVRAAAVRALSATASDDDMDLVAFALRREPDADIRAAAVAHLADPDLPRMAAVELLRRLALEDESPNVREAAAMALGL